MNLYLIIIHSIKMYQYLTPFFENQQGKNDKNNIIPRKIQPDDTFHLRHIYIKRMWPVCITHPSPQLYLITKPIINLY